jgi:hypothetical protein
LQYINRQIYKKSSEERDKPGFYKGFCQLGQISNISVAKRYYLSYSPSCRRSRIADKGEPLQQVALQAP